jgi:hypothetical protein
MKIVQSAILLILSGIAFTFGLLSFADIIHVGNIGVGILYVLVSYSLFNGYYDLINKDK